MALHSARQHYRRLLENPPPAIHGETITGPVYGWRIWRVRMKLEGPLLLSGGRDTPWTPGGVLKTKCDDLYQERVAAHTDDFFSPSWLCTCGIYAWRARQIEWAQQCVASDNGSLRWIAGWSAIWGATIEHEDGWRAACAYPLKFENLNVEAATFADINRRYLTALGEPPSPNGSIDDKRRLDKLLHSSNRQQDHEATVTTL